MTEVWRPSVTVAAVIERGGRFLLVEEEVDGRRVLNQPAGHLDPGESLAQACRREVLEETAQHFAPRELVGIYRWRYAPRDVTFLRFCFCGELEGEAAGRALDKGIVAARWLSLAEIRSRKAEHRSPLVAKCIEDFLAGRRFALDVFSAEFA
jgi:ADP-ribose pyrophosphatase YjhB (NUDIX family)